MFKALKKINDKPAAFEFYTADELWTNEHTSKMMLDYHLNKEIDLSSRNHSFINRSVDWIISHFKLTSTSKVIDFGCGPGLYTSRLATSGVNVTGVDFSSNSIEYARDFAKENKLNIDYKCANYLDIELSDKYDLITIIMCDFCALSPEQRKQLLKKFYSIMNSRSQILLDVYSLNAFDERVEASSYELNQLNNFWSPNDYYAFVNTFKYEQEKVVLDKYTIIEKDRERIVYNWLQYFSKESLRQEFKECGFEITNFIGNVAGDSYNDNTSEFAIIAKKID